MPNLQTLEEAQQEILRQKDELAALTTERDTLKSTADAQTQEIQKLKDYNQSLFQRITTKVDEDTQSTEDVVEPSLEDVGKILADKI